MIALTRERDDRPSFDALTRRGLTVVQVPLVRRARRPVEGLCERLAEGGHDAVVVTSLAAVEALEGAMEALGPGHPAVTGLRERAVAAWAVGPITASALARALRRPHATVAEAPNGRALVARMAAGREALEGRRFLFPAAEGALRAVPEGLLALGAEVDEVVCYGTEPDPDAAERVAEALARGSVLWVLASPSAARALRSALPQGRDADVEVAVLGPTTAEAARLMGFSVSVEAEQPTMEALAEAIAGHLRAS